MLEDITMEKKVNRSQQSPKGIVDTKKNQDGATAKVFPKSSRKREKPNPKVEQLRKPSSSTQKTRQCGRKTTSRSYHNDAGGTVTELAAVDDDFDLKRNKKQNIAHLLNIQYKPREGAFNGTHRSTPRGIFPHNSIRSLMCTQKHKYNKEQFLQANCQFVVRDDTDYSVYMADPDILVEWNRIEQIRVSSFEPVTCPICLDSPSAGKITRCGHVYCWSCILHYLALTDQSWHKCPICFEAVHRKDLKSVQLISQRCFNTGHEISFQLMKREHGSTISVPVLESSRMPNTLLSVSENVHTTVYSKLLLAANRNVLEIIENEEIQLKNEWKENEGCPELCFVEQAMSFLDERKMDLLQKMYGSLNASADNENSNIADEFDELAEIMPTIAPRGSDDEFDELAEIMPTIAPRGSDDEFDEHAEIMPTIAPCGFSRIHLDGSAEVMLTIAPGGFAEETDELDEIIPRITPGGFADEFDELAEIMPPIAPGGFAEETDELDEIIPRITPGGFADEFDKLSKIMPTITAGGFAEEAGCSKHISSGESTQNEVPKNHSSPQYNLLSRIRNESVSSSGDEVCTTVTAEDLEISTRSTAVPSKYYYFYQAMDGQQIFLHSLNVRMLEKEYGSLEQSPTILIGNIVEIETGSMTEELRKRLRYLQHLPSTCQFQVVEIDLQEPIISTETRIYFKDQHEKRCRVRQKKANEEKRMEKKAEVLARKQYGCHSPPRRLRLDSLHHFPECRAGEPSSLSPRTRSPVSSRTSSPASSKRSISPTGSLNTLSLNNNTFAEKLKDTRKDGGWQRRAPTVSESEAGSSHSRNLISDAVEAALLKARLEKEGEQANGRNKKNKKRKKQKAIPICSMGMVYENP